MPRYDPNVEGRVPSALEIANAGFHQQLAWLDSRAIGRVVQEYGGIRTGLQDRAKAMDELIKEAQANGTEMSPSWLYRQERYKDLLLQLNQDTVKVGGGIAQYLPDAQRKYIEAAESYANKASRAQLSRTQPSADATSSVMGRWNSLPEATIKNMMGNLSPGSPLHDLILKDVPQAIAERARTGMLTAIAVGTGSRPASRELDNALGLGVARSLTIMRTETHRAQRQATLESYKANSDIVKGWIWRCSRSVETCAVCWAMDGQLFDTEDGFDTHVNCRCTTIPATRSWEDLGFPGIPEIPDAGNGPDLFSQLDSDTQREILGDAKYNAYVRGDIELKDLVGQTHDLDWGTSRHEVSLAQAYANAGIKPPADLVLPPTAAPKPLPPHEQAIKDLMAVDARLDAEINARANEIADLRAHARELTEKWDSTGRLSPAEIAELDATTDKMQALLTLNREARTGLLNELRAVLYVDDPITINSTFPAGLSKAVKAHWQEGIAEMQKFVSASGVPKADGMNVTFVRLPAGSRAYQLGHGGYSSVHITGDEEFGTMVHELGHAVEEHDRGIMQASADWRDGRTAGEQPRKLSEITGWSGYKASEVTKPDKFMSPYIGKVYESYGRIYGTEVLSMGIEYFYRDPLALARDDPDMFRYIYNAVRGIK